MAARDEDGGSAAGRHAARVSTEGEIIYSINYVHTLFSYISGRSRSIMHSKYISTSIQLIKRMHHTGRLFCVMFMLFVMSSPCELW